MVTSDTDMTDKTAVADVEATEGTVLVKGLGAGTYVITETKAPKGYSINTNIDNVTLTKDSAETRNVTLPVTDTKLGALPSTGGMGTYLFTIIGVVVMAGAEVTLNNDNRYTVTKEITNSLSSEPTPIPTVTPGTNHSGNDRITPIPNNGTAGGTAPNDTSGTARRSVKTGDNTPIGVWVGILAAAIIVGGGAAYGVKRKKKK